MPLKASSALPVSLCFLAASHPLGEQHLLLCPTTEYSLLKPEGSQLSEDTASADPPVHQVTMAADRGGRLFKVY